MFEVILFGLIVMVTYFIEGLIGFGGTIIALPLASEVIGLKMTVPILTIVVLVASIIIAYRDRDAINKKEFFIISCLMLLGLPIGMVLFRVLPEEPLKLALGIFMIFVGIKGLIEMNKKVVSEKAITPFWRFVSYATIFLGGIIHGAFTAGGPFVVVYATRNIKDKTSFRATLCALWATLNTVMLGVNIVNNEITPAVIFISIITVLLVTISIKVSNIVHKKINADSFSKFVYAALILSGILMMS